MPKLLITKKTNLNYLTGFSGSKGCLILGPTNFFFTDSRYAEIAQKLAEKPCRIPFKFIEVNEDFPTALKKCIGKSKVVEFEPSDLTVDELNRWKKRLKGIKLIPQKQTIDEKRKIKDSKEIKLLHISQKLNLKAMERTRILLKPGVTELEIAWLIKKLAHDLGADDVSFEPIVAFGSHSAIPHHQNTSRRLKKTDIALIDMGIKYKGYLSDLTRTHFIGKPSSEQNAVFEKVLSAQKAAIKAIKPGIKASSVDKIARKTMGEDEKYFTHGLGHGVGLEIHEAPSLSSKSLDMLKKGMVVTVEPGIYLPGKFGVRIEDMGLICAEGLKLLN
ncbi:aminopeptidase P family protein [Patescibacteria group bacterium]|nr:aminopeptidase P family protein [Patescibacteria group bacterium]